MTITLLLGGVLLLAALWGAEEVRWEEPACPHGVGHGLQDLRFLKDNDAGPINSPVQELLNRPNFGATPEAAGDLEEGIVDERLVATLLTVTGEHSVCVQSFKSGHRFLPGEPDGPTIPESYGDGGGATNTHYFGRAADIFWVDGKRIQGNGTDPAVLDVGQILAGIPADRRPDEIIGPPDWTRSLGYGWAAGWVRTPVLLDLHRDHFHIGYNHEVRTNNTR